MGSCSLPNYDRFWIAKDRINGFGMGMEVRDAISVGVGSTPILSLVGILTLLS